MDKREKKILRLLEDGQTYTLTELAEKLECSRKTAWNAIQMINKDIEPSVAQIVSKSGRGNGYCLQIIDEETYHNHVQNDGLSQQNILDKSSRKEMIIWILLNAQDYVRMEDLEDELYLSNKQINQEMKEVRRYLKNFSIQVEMVPHYGMKIRGLEKDICLCLSRLNENDRFLEKIVNDEQKNLLDQTKEILNQILASYGYQIYYDQLENLQYILFFVCLRNQQGFPFEPMNLDDHVRENDMAYELFRNLNTRLGLHLTSDHVAYISLHLHAKKTIRNGCDIVLSQEVSKLTRKVLARIDNVYHIGLENDFNLCMMLAQHFQPLLTRIKHGIQYDNPLLQEIKSKFLFEYELASIGATAINEQYHCHLSDDEISYIALYINLSFQQRNNHQRKRILLVCSSGRGSSEILRLNFMKNFSDYIEKVAVAPTPYLDTEKVKGYDLIFTTLALPKEVLEKIDVKVVRINNFLDENDLFAIRNILDTNKKELLEVYRYFPMSLFLSDVDVPDKEALIDIMVARIKSVKQVDGDLKEQILQRESVASTSFGNQVAFPHPVMPLTDKTFVAISVLKKPIVWDDFGHRVRVVFMVLIEKNNDRDLEVFYSLLSSIMSDREKIRELIRNPQYQTLLRLLSQEMQ